MKFAEIGKRRLESLISYDEGIDKRELSVFEKEIRRVIAEYFMLKNKDVKITFRKNGDGIDINVYAFASEIKDLKIM